MALLNYLEHHPHPTTARRDLRIHHRHPPFRSSNLSTGCETTVAGGVPSSQVTMRIPSRAYLIRPARTRRGIARHISKPVRSGPSKASITSRTSPKGGSPASWRSSMALSTMAIRLRPGAILVSTIASLLSPVACTLSTGYDTTADQSRIFSAGIAAPGWPAGLSPRASRGFADLTLRIRPRLRERRRRSGLPEGLYGADVDPVAGGQGAGTRVEHDPLGEPLSQQAAQLRQVRPIPGMHGGRGLDLDRGPPARPAAR